MNNPGVEWQLCDELWQERHHAETLAALEAALKNAPLEYSRLWRDARLRHFQAMQAEENNRAADALRFFEAARNSAQKAVDENRHDVEGQFWLGVNTLEWSRRKSKLHAAAALKSAAHHIERAMNQDESFHFAGPLRVWGRITHLKPLALGGSLDRALDVYRRALQVCAHNSTTRLYYAEALLADRQNALARKTFHEIIDAHRDGDWVWEQARDRRLAKLHIEKMDASL